MVIFVIIYKCKIINFTPIQRLKNVWYFDIPSLFFVAQTGLFLIGVQRTSICAFLGDV